MKASIRKRNAQTKRSVKSVEPLWVCGSIHVKHDCNCYDDSSSFSSKVLELNNHSESEINSRGGKHPAPQGAASKNGLTARASPLLSSGTKVGLCFLGLRVGSLWPPSEPPPPPLLLSPPASSPVQPQILPLVEGMFSLLVSACSGAILFAGRKLGRKRKLCSTSLPLRTLSV